MGAAEQSDNTALTYWKHIKLLLMTCLGLQQMNIFISYQFCKYLLPTGLVNWHSTYLKISARWICVYIYNICVCKFTWIISVPMHKKTNTYLILLYQYWHLTVFEVRKVLSSQKGAPYFPLPLQELKKENLNFWTNRARLFGFSTYCSSLSFIEKKGKQ